MNTFCRNLATNFFHRPTLQLVASCLLTSLLAGCYIPTEGIRSANPGPTASPSWPYEPGTLPPGRTGHPEQYPGALVNPASPIPGSHTLPYPAAYGNPGYAVAPFPQPMLAQETPAGYPVAYGGTPPSNPTPPPPSQSSTPQYATWLVDGPEGRGFAYYLSAGYRRYAKLEDNAHDFEDAAKFLFRAGEVDRGEKVMPELLTMRTLPAYAVDDLLYARQRLMAVFSRGATSIFPKLAASAQVNFDCWMEQQEENSQPQDISQCRRGYEEDIVRLETALIARAPAAPAAPCPAPAARPVCDANPLYVLFDLGKHDLTSSGRTVLQHAVELTRHSGNIPLIVAAHTDRAGSDAYNDALSKRRLDTVIGALEASGIPAERLARANYYGESRPRVETADGVPAQENRRVEIRLACKLAESDFQCLPRPVAETPCDPRSMATTSPCARY